MGDRIYSVIRCKGKGASKCIRNAIDADNFGIYNTQRVNGSKEDILIWFSGSSEEFDHVNEEYLLKKLEELGKGKFYKGCEYKWSKDEIGYPYHNPPGTYECDEEDF